MTVFTGVIVYILTWWVVIFTVLPFGLERDEDGTPRVPHLKRKFVITTVVAFLIWAMLYALIDADLISFRDMAAAL